MRRMTMVAAAALLAVVPAGGSLSAQQQPVPAKPSQQPDTARQAPDTERVRNEIELTRSAIETRRTDIVGQVMHLTTAQSNKFWPLYREYRGEVGKLNDQAVHTVMKLAGRGTPLSDDDAKRLLDQFFKNQQQRIDIQKKYAKKFGDVIPGKQVARLFQLENKMDAVMEYELAGNVPLIGGP